MSPAQSEDSGLAADRGTAYATIAIPRFDSGQPGIVLAERLDLSFPPVVESISGPVADLLAPGDRIHQVDGISTVGLSNAHILGLLGHGADGPAMIEIEYSFPEYSKSSASGGGGVCRPFIIAFLFSSVVPQFRKTVCA